MVISKPIIIRHLYLDKYLFMYCNAFNGKILKRKYEDTSFGSINFLKKELKRGYSKVK